MSGGILPLERPYGDNLLYPLVPFSEVDDEDDDDGGGELPFC